MPLAAKTTRLQKKALFICPDGLRREKQNLELEETLETIKPSTNILQMRWRIDGGESATARQDSGLSAPSSNYIGSQGFHLGQEAAETA